MAITEEDLRTFALRTERPIPGQSLTADPEKPMAYEKAPKFASKDEAIEYFFKEILDDDTFPELMNLLDDDVPVMDVVQVILVDAFENGLVNPDLMLLLAEPLAYILMGLAERQGIRVRIVTDPDDPDDPNDRDNWGNEADADALDDQTQNIFRDKLQGITNPKADEELDLDSKIKDAPSLMARGG